MISTIGDHLIAAPPADKSKPGTHPLDVLAGRQSSFFFSSRRQHTRCYRDWSSDVCSSDLGVSPAARGGGWWSEPTIRTILVEGDISPLRSEERREGKSVDLGGRRIIKK